MATYCKASFFGLRILMVLLMVAVTSFIIIVPPFLPLLPPPPPVFLFLPVFMMSLLVALAFSPASQKTPDYTTLSTLSA
ncbi:hypothetical protein SADUNF_Sadunf06G0024900 [Salix dunnii]|uniref:Transmembrane protein n=1 Tax=Salix dunnii TaxID=1413687 RepID=A0A835MWK1_9ROSI|nr:hypothetical protein SADUNF_Sadunf06G0024900 [Salix dunnii]